MSGHPHLLLVIVLAVNSLIIFRFASTGEFSYNVDETEHANTGLYFASLLKDLPLRHPIQYTYYYYGHYPDLGLVHWPPLFYMVEGVIFRVFGPSVLSARATVALFALLAFCFWFKFLAELHGERVAAIGTLLLGVAPIMLLFEKTVMLEVPAIAFSIGAIYYWCKYLKEEQARHVYLFALLVSAGLLTKQTVMFLGPFCLLTIVALRKWHLLFSTATLKAIAIVLALVGPFYWLVFKVHLSNVKGILLTGTGTENPFIYYLKALPAQFGWPLLLLASFGVATSRIWGKGETIVVMLLWIVSCYVTFTLISTKDPRYTIYWVPAFIYFAIGPAGALKPRAFGLVSDVALIGVTISLLLLGWSYRRPYVAGYAAAATRITKLESSGVILFDGPLPGNFIFYLRCTDPHFRFVVLRKALYVENTDKAYGSLQLLHTTGDLLDLLKRDGIRFILVCDRCPLSYPIQQTLRDLLRSRTDQFTLVGRLPLESNVAAWRDRVFLLWENTKASRPTEKYILIKMMTLRHDIVIPLQ